MNDTLLNDTDMTWLTAQLGRLLQLKPLNKGMTNACFIAETATGSYVIKKLNLERLTLNQRQQHSQLQQYFYRIGLSTQIVNHNTQLEIQPYAPLGDLAAIGQPKTQKVALLGRLLAQIHQGAPQPPVVLPQRQSLFEDLNYYAQNEAFIARQSQSFRTTLFDALKRAQQLDDYAQIHANNRVVCHGDLSFENIVLIEAQQGIKSLAIDWEYARCAPPIYDLAASICINHLNAIERMQLIKHYQHTYADYNEKQTMSVNSSKLDDYIQVFSILNDCWLQFTH